MEASLLKQKIHSLIDNSNEEILESVYQLLQDSDYTEEFKNVLNEELVAYQKGGKIITQKEMNELIKDEMNK